MREVDCITGAVRRSLARERGRPDVPDAMDAGTGKSREAARGRAFRSPWLDQLDPSVAPCPLDRDAAADVAIVGAGIAGVATAFFLLRDTDARVVMLERDRAGHGASGRNAGQLVTYFERPLCDLVDAYGFDLATRAQAEVDAAWDLLDQIIEASGIAVPVERITGGMGMFTLNHLLVHLRNVKIRSDAGLLAETIEVSEAARFLHEIPSEFRAHFSVVPQARIRERLNLSHDDYVAVLMNRKGCGNSALICQELLRFLRRSHTGRFQYFDRTPVGRIVLGASGAVLEAGHHKVAAGRVVLCTNGFNQHHVETLAGDRIGQLFDERVEPVVGYMAGFAGPPGAPARAESYIVNERIGGAKPYHYVTRRPYLQAGMPTTLTCLGGPESGLSDAAGYDPEGEMPGEVLAAFDETVRPATVPERAEGLPYDYTWHGLMAYTPNKLRLIGHEPRNPVLMYNLGCNGVGFLPSLAGGRRIARLHAGENLPPSLFDPT